MTINYSGSAGGQPRLLIPSLGQFEDPAVQRAMLAIQNWGNRLLLSGGGAPIAYGFFDGVPGNPATWTLVWGNYVDVSGSNVNFPTNSVSLITVDYGVSDSAGTPFVTSLGVELRSAANGLISLGVFNQNGTSVVIAASASASSIADTATAIAPFPWNVAATLGTSGGSPNISALTMSIMSFTHP